MDNKTLSMRAQGLIDVGCTLKNTAKLLNVKHQWLKAIINTPVTFDFGIEIEVSEINRHWFGQLMREHNYRVFDYMSGWVSDSHEFDINNQTHWRIMKDASCGIEIISPILKGASGMIVLEEVLGYINQSDPEVNEKCGLHVHIARIDFVDISHQLSFTELYRDTEQDIDRIMPRSRRGNNNSKYCKSMRGETIYKDSRYYKVNLKNEYTIEIRHHSGTTEWYKISNWLRLLQQLVNNSKNYEGKFTDDGTQIPLKNIVNRPTQKYITKRSLELKRDNYPSSRRSSWRFRLQL